jgi:muramoyltetrapeptide carboxypeptidase
VRWGEHLFERRGFLAGTPEQRAADLGAALSCPETRLIVCARGGVGSADLLEERWLDRWLPVAAAAGKWLIGFSDITALHSQWQALGLPSIHASNVTSLGVGCAALHERWLSHVLDPWAKRRWQLETLFAGKAQGPLAGGNLAVLHDLCASHQWSPAPGSLLFLEDVGEPPYRLYRMLRSLHRGGHLRQVAGLVVGQLSASHPGVHRVSARAVFQELCAEWKLPAAWGVPSGHELGQNHPLTFGIAAELDATVSGAELTMG